MIKLHDGVAINPINLVSIVNNGDSIAFINVSGRANKVIAANARFAFDQWCQVVERYVPLLHVSDGRAVNVDAIISVAKVATAIALNMVGGHTEYITVEGDDAKAVKFTAILNEINKLESEAA